MSLVPPTFLDKRCFAYCGDDHCNCKCSPYYLKEDYGMRILRQKYMDSLLEKKKEDVETDKGPDKES